MKVSEDSLIARSMRAFGGGAFVASACLVAPSAFAQSGPSREIVQPLPPEATNHLGEALRQLATEPRNLEALLTAGRASLELGDTDAATGFFARAQALGTSGGRAKAGLAAAQVRKKLPVEALRLFAEAEEEGASLESYAGDCGLAYDLVGDNARAQQFYRRALESGEDQEITRRLALSQAIGGDQAGSDATLLPLLQRRDLAAYRTRAFALAALGKTEEAVAIAEAVMPASLASRITPYLRYMPRLTRAQQAAAANFGHFPEAAAIGQDDPRIAEYAAAAQPARAGGAALDQRLVPSGDPLGEAPRPVPPDPAPQIDVAMVQEPREPEASPAGEVPLREVSPPQEENIARPSISVAVAEESEELPAGQIEEDFDLGALAGSQASGAIEVESVAGGQNMLVSALPGQQAGGEREMEPSPPEPASLADAFADFSLAPQQARPAPGAVDITAIEPAREAEQAAQPEKPAHPSRIWVQVATGRDRSALAFDWRRLSRKAAGLLGNRTGYLVDWGRTNRLVTGPFDSNSAAADFVNALKQEDIASFAFTSAAGEEVLPLPGS